MGMAFIGGRKVAVAGAVLGCVLFGAGSALAADATGTWSGVVNLANGRALPFVARLKQQGQSITGTLDGIGGAPDVEILDGKADKNVIKFFGVRQINKMPVRFAYTGHMTDAAIDFDIVRVDGQGAPLKSHTTKTAE